MTDHDPGDEHRNPRPGTAHEGLHLRAPIRDAVLQRCVNIDIHVTLCDDTAPAQAVTDAADLVSCERCRLALAALRPRW